MYLQTTLARMADFACVKMQAADGVNRRRWIALMPAMILGSMIAAAPSGGQTAIRASFVERLTFINSAYINQEGSPLSGAVNFGDSSLPQGVNQFDSSSSALPEAPSALMQEQSLLASTPSITRGAPPGSAKVAPIYWKEIPAGWVAQPLTASDKRLMGMRGLYSPFSLLGALVTAGYAQVENGQPNYGTNAGAFGKRLGVVTLRDMSEGAFTNIVFAPMLHNDPRYYVEGPQHNFFHRVVYAVTRPIVTRTDSGRATVNGAELLGDASASALSYTYYPNINQNFHDTAATFGGALLGSSLSDLVREFSGQVLKAAHLTKNQ